ncbi:isocitrate lyase/phosphoenolpyruvate mutase family protein [Ensifer sp. ENS05]|nr:isocitrate lyase/phosphoenolpyruvate mutase family protein [Ensifer sp. ENS05]
MLIHSKKADSTEIEEFCRQWNNLCPVVLVPTKYYKTPADRFRALNVSAVIWANHTMRAAITAMEAVCRRVHAEESLSGVESEIASLACLFELTGEADYAAFAERFSASGALA